MRHAALVLTFLVAACAPEGADDAERVGDLDRRDGSGGMAGACPDRTPVAIERDALGGLSFDLTLTELRDRCPAARDTTWGMYERTFPGLYLPMEDLTVFALQDRTVVDEESGFDIPDDPAPGAPPDIWVVSGAGGSLPEGVPTDARWSEVRAAYGEAMVSDEIFLTATFCALPGWRFHFPYEAHRAGDIDPEARIEMIMVSFQDWRLRMDAAACE